MRFLGFALVQMTFCPPFEQPTACPETTMQARTCRIFSDEIYTLHNVGYLKEKEESAYKQKGQYSYKTVRIMDLPNNDNFFNTLAILQYNIAILAHMKPYNNAGSLSVI